MNARPTIHPAGVAAGTPCVDEVNTSYLESLLGYNARRAALVVIEVFLQRMAVYDLRPVDFSVLSLVTHNPGITSRQLCTALGILAPNLVGMVKVLEKRGLIQRLPHPHDGRAMGLHLTAPGKKMMRAAEQTASELETEVAARLTLTERTTLLKLLKKVYK
ncbi:MarR family winged helix-turn-helix transcriptional regulator [Rhodoferax sp.]|uniref:MarR family winged helix-turn-helix transcriptional regulator n=1 Tax=Rhodoferax sp. TaxID=50421 RepID=UPI002743EAE5|nr:MarR family transcriptional regulator [Rhodoferax sp.]